MGNNVQSPATGESRPSADGAEGKYSWFVRNTAISLAIVGAVFGIGFLIMGWAHADTSKKLKVVILAPAILAGLGYCLGVCLTCVVAPADFLRGPQGRKWMKLIGTKSVALARVVCAVLGVILFAALAGVACLLYMAPSS